MKVPLPPPKLMTRRLCIVLWKHFFLALNADRNCILHSLQKSALVPLQQLALVDVYLLIFAAVVPSLDFEVMAVVVVLHPAHATYQALFIGLIKALNLANLMVFLAMLILKVFS